MSMQTEIRTVYAGQLPMSSAHRAKEVTTVEDEARIGSYFADIKKVRFEAVACD